MDRRPSITYLRTLHPLPPSSMVNVRFSSSTFPPSTSNRPTTPFAAIPGHIETRIETRSDRQPQRTATTSCHLTAGLKAALALRRASLALDFGELVGRLVFAEG